MPGSGAPTEALILDTLREEAARRPLAAVLLIGIQACATVDAANRIVGAERVALLHLDRAAGAVGCGLGNRESFFGDAPLSDGVSLIAVNVEAAKSYRLLREIVAQTARVVDPTGAVLVAGPRKGGAEVAARALHDALESVVLLAYRKGHRIYRATSPRPQEHAAADDDLDRAGSASAPAASASGHRGRASEHPNDTSGHPDQRAQDRIETVTLRGRPLRVLLDDRIFARGRLDPATRMLAETFEVPPRAAILDLGSGNGVLGILAALLEPTAHAWLVDSDPLAVRASRENAALNGASNLSVHLSDVLHDLPDRTFDVVLMNPPFHRGRTHDTALAERFIDESSRALRPGGVIYVVCNRFLRYEPILQRLVGPAREVAGDRRFKVLLARHGTSGQ
jgi:16S rRNA (guanine1207-N2)-methyltransferase